jgi:hypothetical protein
MNMHLRPQPAPAGSPDELREYAAEMLGMAVLQCEVGQRYAELRDDAGLNEATRKLIAYVRALVETVKDINGARI